MSLSLWPHGLQHIRLPCPSLSPGVCLNSCSLSWWCYLTTSSYVTPSPLPLIFPESVFPNDSALYIKWPKYLSFRISPSNEYSGLISFRIDWFYLLAVQGTLKNLLYHHNLKESILWCSVFFMVQLSYLYNYTSIWNTQINNNPI